MGGISSVRFFSMIKEIPVKSGRLYVFFFFICFRSLLIRGFPFRTSPQSP